MSVRKLTTSLLTTLAFLAGGQPLVAQNNNYLTPGDPFHLEPDVGWFEPVYDADILDVKPKKRANTGWYATVDKLALFASRPELTVSQDRSERAMDDGSGTRYEFGYMLPEEHGYLFNYTNFGVGEFDGFEIQRINRLNDEELTGDAEFAAPPFGLDALIDTDGNNFGFNTRFYNVGRTLNTADLDSYELNKTWRLEPYHYGGILEPMVGFRFVQLTDINARSQYARAFEDIVGFLDDQYFIPGGPAEALAAADAVEQYDSFINDTDNKLFTGQVGARYFKFNGRMRYSAEARLFSGISMQRSEYHETRETTVYDGFDVGADVNTYVFSATHRQVVENEEFFIGFDLRSEVGLQLTKMIHIRGGLQLLHLSSGIWRGGVTRGLLTGGDRDQDFVAFGGTFGLELNR